MSIDYASEKTTVAMSSGEAVNFHGDKGLAVLVISGDTVSAELLLFGAPDLQTLTLAFTKPVSNVVYRQVRG